MKGKYIVIKTKLGEIPILFPDSAKHDSIYDRSKIISAGFFKLRKNGFTCFGESESLGISSRDKLDADLMDVFFCLD